MSAGTMLLGAPPPGGGVKALRSLALPVAAISVLFVMVVPVPAFVMDMLLACSMAASTIHWPTLCRQTRCWLVR